MSTSPAVEYGACPDCGSISIHEAFCAAGWRELGELHNRRRELDQLAKLLGWDSLTHVGGNYHGITHYGSMAWTQWYTPAELEVAVAVALVREDRDW